MGKCVVKECNSRSQKHNKSSGITFHTFSVATKSILAFATLMGEIVNYGKSYIVTSVFRYFANRIPKDAARCNKWVKVIRLLRKETDWLPSKSTVICSKHFQDQDKLGPKSDGSRVYLSDEAVPMLVTESHSVVQAELSTKVNMDVDDVETDEDINEITETPQSQKMRQTINRLRIVSTRRRKKIKILSQKNRRLEIRNRKLKEVLKELKKTHVEQRRNSAKFKLRDSPIDGKIKKKLCVCDSHTHSKSTKE